MSDGKIDYEIGGDSSGLTGALQKAQQAGQAAGLQISNSMGKLGAVGQGVAIVMAVHAAWERMNTVVRQGREQVESFNRASANVSLGNLNSQLSQAEATMVRLRTEVENMSGWQAMWETIQNTVTGTNVRVEQLNAAHQAAMTSLDGITSRNLELARIQTLRNQGKEREAELLTIQLRYSHQIAELEQKRAAALPSLADGYNKQIEAVKKVEAAELDGVRKKFDAMAASKAQIDEQAAAAMELTTELEEQDRHYEAMKDDVGVAAKAAHDHRIQAQELVKSQEAWADVLTQGQASQERLEKTTATIGKHFGDQATLLDKLKTAIGIIRGNVEQTAGFWGTVTEKAQEGVDKARALMATLSTVRTTTEAIVTAQVKHTAEVNLTSTAMDRMARNTERTLNVSTRILDTLREINRQATVAGSNIAVLG